MARRTVVSVCALVLVTLGIACSRSSSSASSDPTIAAAGDIACDPTSPDFNGGAGTDTACAMQRTSDLLVGTDLAAVLALGDEQYACGSQAEFAGSYDPTWGRMKSITHPVPGNQEYNTGSGCDQTGQAAGYFSYFGSAAGLLSEGWYSFDIGTWHIIALNSNCAQVGGCITGSSQERWLRNDLATHPATCTLAFWHHPRFSSGSNGNDKDLEDIWTDLYRAGVDVVLNGHDHGYERFAPQDPNQKLDPTHGIREFVVGTGGDDHGSFSGTLEPNSEVRNNDTFGVLKLALHPTGYDWSFVPVAGGTFTDTGSGTCHGTLSK